MWWISKFIPPRNIPKSQIIQYRMCRGELVWGNTTLYMQFNTGIAPTLDKLGVTIKTGADSHINTDYTQCNPTIKCWEAAWTLYHNEIHVWNIHKGWRVWSCKHWTYNSISVSSVWTLNLNNSTALPLLLTPPRPIHGQEQSGKTSEQRKSGAISGSNNWSR